MYYKEENDFFLKKCSIGYFDVEVINASEIIFLDINFFKSKQDFNYRKHCHPNYEIIIPASGDYECLINGQELSVQVGELLLVQEGDWHQDILRSNTEFICIAFAINNPENSNYDNPANANIHRRLFKDKTAAINHKMIFSRDELSNVFFKLLTTIGIEQDDSSAYYYYILDGIFHSFFWKIIFLFPEDQLSPWVVNNSNNEETKQQLLKIFDKNIHARLDVSKIAACMNMSRGQLTYKCKDIIGESPARAFIRYKLKRAKAYLKDSTFSIKQISDMLGFDDQFIFSKTFKRVYGVSPAVYRKKH